MSDEEQKYRYFMRQWAHRQGYKIGRNRFDIWKYRIGMTLLIVSALILLAYCFADN